MPEAQRWLVVNENTKIIVGGPYLWDGHTQWTPPDEGTLILEADADAGGYQWPTYPDPEPQPDPDPEPNPDQNPNANL